MDKNNNWRFCAVGNIKARHTDETGKVLYGTKAFSGGTKVYINDMTEASDDSRISVIGLNRFGRYVVERVPADLIENIRLQRIYKPTVLKIIDYLEAMENWPWRKRTAEDRKAITAFVDMWNSL